MVKKIAISLPDDLFDRLEAARRSQRRSRSGLIQEILGRELPDEAERARRIAQYIEGYRRFPEIAEEKEIYQLGAPIVLDESLIERIQHQAHALGLSVDALVAKVLEEHLQDQPGPGAAPRARAALRALDRLFEEHGGEPNATAVIRADRDAR